MIVAAAATAVASVGVYFGRHKIVKAWVPSSPDQLEASERKMLELSGLDAGAIEHLDVPCASEDGKEKYTLHVIRIRARGRPEGKAETEGEGHAGADEKKGEGRLPIVLLHGFGGGVGLWAKNLARLSEDQDLYAIDLLGFGRSSRPPFRSTNAEEAQRFWVASLDACRAGLGIEKMVLVGHSLGAYISGFYQLAHPERVHRLVLVSPFGMVRETGFRSIQSMPFAFRTMLRMAAAFSPQVRKLLSQPSLLLPRALCSALCRLCVLSCSAV